MLRLWICLFCGRRRSGLSRKQGQAPQLARVCLAQAWRTLKLCKSDMILPQMAVIVMVEYDHRGSEALFKLSYFLGRSQPLNPGFGLDSGYVGCFTL
mgnify:CR=1 FL=1